ncbi:MAG: SpoVG family protein [Clostridiales bacterium]|nr:SpoVG family protein [Clostridiales bacterium]
MKYSIKVNEVTNGSENLKGLATVVLGDSFKLSNIKIFNNPEKNELFVAMPSYKTNQVDDKGNPVYNDIFNPTTKEFRESLYKNILDAYKELHENQAKNSYTVEINSNDTKMPEFSIRVTPYEKEGSSIKGLCSAYFDNSLVVNNITLHQGKDDKIFVSMPNYKTSQVDEKGKAVYKDICNPVTAKFREKFYDAIMNGYEQALEQALEKVKEPAKDSVKDKLSKNKEAVEKNQKQDAPEKGKKQPSRDEAR